MVMEFIRSLGRSRVTGVQSKIKGKQYSTVARAKGKSASKFNAAVDAPMQAVKKKSKRRDKDGGDQTASEKKGGKMGLFGRKKKQPPAPSSQRAAPESDDSGMQQTRAISIGEIVDDRSQDCVGWLVALTGELKGRDFRLTPGKNLIGTSANCEVVLTDQYMSARHATVNYEEGRFTFTDLDSTNGSYVNEKRVAREELIDNDKIRLGRTELKFKSLF